MRYVMKSKAFSLGGDFTITNEAGEMVYLVRGRLFSLGKNYSFQDLAGSELARIEQKLLSLGANYEIHCRGELAAVVKEHLFTVFRHVFSIDVPGPDDLEAQGDFFDAEYRFMRGQREVAEVSKRWFNWTDTYGVEIADDQDQVLILASALVIEIATMNRRKMPPFYA
jgi:uncharacterized protein YxjI